MSIPMVPMPAISISTAAPSAMSAPDGRRTGARRQDTSGKRGIAEGESFMNVAYLSAFSALVGSAIGGVASIATTWLTQHSEDRAQRHAESVGRRERLYGDFIDESSTLFVDALTHGQLDPSKFVQIYATIGKLRLFASADFVSEADKAMKDISEIYYLPNRNFTKRENASETDLNILQAFSEACRNDLRE
jgi:hypothetical protein